MGRIKVIQARILPWLIGVAAVVVIVSLIVRKVKKNHQGKKEN